MAGEVIRVFLQALRDFLGTWPRLLLTGFLYQVLAFVLLTPLAALVLRAFIASRGGAIADQDILYFLLSPTGLMALIVVSAILLAILAIEQACLMMVGFGAVRDTRVETSQALEFGLRNAARVLHLTTRIVIGLLVIAVPFLALGGLIFYLFLTKHDINFYLSQRPPEFWLAGGGIALVLLVGGVLVVKRLIGWALALPFLLFERFTPAAALDASQDRIRGHRLTTAIVLVLWGLTATVLSSSTFAGLRFAGVMILPGAIGSIKLLVLLMGVLLIGWALSSVLISLINTASFALLIVRLYELAGIQEGRLEWSIAAGRRGETVAAGFSLKKLLAGAAVATVAAALVGYLFMGRVRPEDDVLVIAHRGAAAAAPENTIASIELAIAEGADFVEIDVQETADGAVVVIHDSDFMKIANVSLKIWDATYDQIQDLDVGSWFAPEFSDQRVPTLREVLELARGRAKVVIELKYYGHDERLEERVVDIVEETDMVSDVMLMSLKADAIPKLKALRPDWSIGLLTAKAVGDLTRAEADFLAVNIGMAKRSFVSRAQRAGKPVWVWTVNDRVNMSRMMSRGVDGVITDEPALAKSVLERRAEMTIPERLLLDLAFLFGVVPSEVETDVTKA